MGINPDSMISYDSIYFGYAPGFSPQVTMEDLNGATGQKGATYNVYSQLTSDNVNSGSYSGNNQYNVQDIIDSGAVLIASLMPFIDWTDITPNLCESVNNYFTNTFTSKGTIVWLRFAHEMNYYVTPGSGGASGGPNYPGGDNPSEFQTAWTNMYNAIKGNDMIKMYWSPNEASASDLGVWWPGASQADIVGMDVYPRVNGASGLPSFASAYGDFYTTYAEPNSLPFALGETGTNSGSGGTADISQREAWLKEVINPGNGDFSDYPLYMSATWFEYGPPNNPTYYVVYGQSGAIVTETISNTEGGSAS